MSEQEEQSIKQELLELMQNSMKSVELLSDEEIVRRQTKFNLETGIGYLVTNEQFHLWIVKLPGR